MIVKDASVDLSSARQYSATTTRRESLRAWMGSQRPSVATAQRQSGASGGAIVDEAQIDGRASAATATGLQSRASALTTMFSRPAVTVRLPQAPSWPSARCVSAEEDEDAGLDTESRIAKWVAEQMLGHKIHIFHAHPAQSQSSSCEQPQAQATPQPAGWGVDYQRTDTYSEAETTSFQSEGSVVTADGRQITFSVSLEMARQYTATTQVSLRAGDAVVDPLVINLEGGAGQLSSTRFDFDLDVDGEAESVPFVAQGSGVLVFDRNGDGVANDGSELFGPTTGDGFAELAALDGDGNGWIDEADSATADLRVWTKDAQGGDLMQTLTEAGVGAIYLGHAQTQFAVKDAANDDLGEVVSTGVYLKENGEAGTVQQVNLTA